MNLIERIRKLPVTKHQRKHVLQIADEVDQLLDDGSDTNLGWIIKYVDESGGPNIDYAWDDETGTAPQLKIAYNN